MIKLNLYTPSQKALEIHKPKFRVFQKGGEISACELTFFIPFKVYKDVKSEGLFNLHPIILKGQDDGFLTTEFPVQFKAFMTENLLSELPHYLSDLGSEDITTFFNKLASSSPFLSTENWFATSIFQNQASGHSGCQTPWSFLFDKSQDSANQNKSTIDFFQHFLGNSAKNELAEIVEQIVNLRGNNAELFGDLQDFGDNPQEIGDDIVSSIAAEISEAISSLSDPDSEIWKDDFNDNSFLEALEALEDLLNSKVWQDLSQNNSKSQRSSFRKTPKEQNPRHLECLNIEAVKLSLSLLWDLQDKHFKSENRGHDNYAPASSNLFNGDASAIYYAHLVAGLLRDCIAITKRHKTNFSVLDKTQTIYVIEVGAGSGQFAYRVLQSLQSLLIHPNLKKLNITYVLTDFAAENLTFWQQHPALQPFFEQGCLDVALFDLQNPGPITLQRSGETLTPDTLANPLVVIANNVFGCLPQDAYYIESGTLHDDLISLSAPEDADPNHWQTLSQLSLRYEQKPIAADRTDIPETLQQYCQTCDDSHILWPTVALQSLDYLRNLAGDRLMVISSDLAYCHEVSLQGNGEPVPAVNGYLTFPVNYHALAAHAKSQGGQALQPPQATPGFSTQVLLFGDHPTQFRETQAAYNQATSQRGGDLLFSSLVSDQLEALSLPQLVTYLQHHHWDADVFLQCFSALTPQLETATPALRHDVIQGVHQAWQGYYALEGDSDLAFYVAMVLYTLEDYASAIDYFEKSRQSHGDDPSTLYNLALSYLRLGQTPIAMACLERTLAIDPTFEAAQILADAL